MTDRPSIELAEKPTLRKRIPGKKGSIRTRQLRIAEQNSLRDALTGLHNRTWFDEELKRLHSKFIRKHEKYWAVFMDIDNFRTINNTKGHAMGDKVLRALGEIGSREEEPVSRYGGEEFVQLIRNGLTLEEVTKIVTRYSQNFKESSRNILGYPATISFGIARVEEGESPQDLVARADAAMYNSKTNGRNKATLADGPTATGKYTDLSLTPEAIKTQQ